MIGRVAAIVVLLSALAGCVPAGAGSPAKATHVFQVTGMTCGLCSKAIEKTVRRLEGVEHVSIDRKAERVEIAARPYVSAAMLEKAIESAGRYEAELLEGE